MLHGRL